MLNLTQNELEQIAEMRRIKNYKNMLKEELLITLLKLKQSLAELYKSKSNNAQIEETKNFFNELRDKFSKQKKKKEKEIRKKLYEEEKADEYFKELEENEEKKVKNIKKNKKKNIKKNKRRNNIEKNQKKIIL